MPKREFDRRPCAGRYADNNRLIDPKFGEKRRMRIGLRSGRSIYRNRRSEITEARGRDDAKPVADELFGNGKALVAAAARAVNGEERRADAFIGVFDWTCRSAGDAASPLDGGARSSDVVLIGQKKGAARERQRSSHRKDQPPSHIAASFGWMCRHRFEMHQCPVLRASAEEATGCSGRAA
jgi:hypothetical protein